MPGVKYSGNLGVGRPAWMADYANREHLALFPAKLLASAFTDALSVVVTVGAAGAAIGATSIPIDALTLGGLDSEAIAPGAPIVAIPAGVTLWFGGAKYATLTANANVGDTALTVAAIPTALVDNDVARYSPSGQRTVLSGTPVGRTFAERDAGTAFGPASLEGTVDDEIYLVAFDVVDVLQNNDVELYRNGERVKENYLPNYAAFTAGGLAKIRALYQCLKGVD